MDINRLPDPAPQQPIQPIQWTWIVQRQETPDAKADSIWKFGFIAPDGAECRVTFHQVQHGDPGALDQAGQSADVDPSMQTPPPTAAPDSSDGPGFAPPGQPNTDNTQDSIYYVTFFSNRAPDFFMKWDISLSHEDSLVTWVTITHGIMDFVRKAKPANVILDDLSNGKLKMILRSVAMDVAAANPEYSLEQTQKHHYRSFFQIKKTGVQSAFQTAVQGTGREGETEQPGQSQKPQAPPQPGQEASQPPEQSNAFQTGDPHTKPQQTVPNDNDNGASSEGPAPPEQQPAFPSHEPAPIKQTPVQKKGLTIEIGMDDYSVAVKDKDGNAVDRYRAKGPADILRWLNKKGYAANRMIIVKREMPSRSTKPKIIITRTPATDSTVKPVTGSALGVQEEVVQESYMIEGTTIRMLKIVPAKQAALMNYIVNANEVKCTNEAVEFVFGTDKDMNFKRALVELAFERTKDASQRNKFRKDAAEITSQAGKEL